MLFVQFYLHACTFKRKNWALGNKMLVNINFKGSSWFTCRINFQRWKSKKCMGDSWAIIQFFCARKSSLHKSGPLKAVKLISLLLFIWMSKWSIIWRTCFRSISTLNANKWRPPFNHPTTHQRRPHQQCPSVATVSPLQFIMVSSFKKLQKEY